MYKILIADKFGQAGIDLLDTYDDVTYDVRLKLSKEELITAIPEYDALIVRSSTRPDADIIAAGQKLKVIGRAGIGVDNIDIDAATRQGVIVMNTPQGNSVATAEQTLTLMLAASRHTAPAHTSLAAGEWARSKFSGTELYDKTLGVVGFGRIGRLVTQRAQAFGMHVIAYDPYVSESVGRDLNVTLVDLDDLFAQADYITLHSVLNQETTKMINAEAIAQMKENAVIVNVARGKLIDEEALASALREGKIRAAALDVYSSEPPQDNPLIGLPNVLHTPHLGASTAEAQRNVAIQMVEQIVDALRQTDYRNALNVPFRTEAGFASAQPYIALGHKLGILQAAFATDPITKVEVEVTGENMDSMVHPVTAALLHGLLQHKYETINLINAPLFAQEEGINIEQTYGLEKVEYNNLISCRVHSAGGSRLLAGVLFGGVEPRLVQMDEYRLEAKPEGTLLFLENEDVPGVIGQVATILATYNVNIAEWRLGRAAPGGRAMSFINLDGTPPETALEAIRHAVAVTQAQLIQL